MAGRLTLALEDGAVSLGDARTTVVFGPPAGYDLSAFPPDKTTIIQGFRPDYDAWEARGYTVVPEPGPLADAALVVLPRARAAAHAALAAAQAAVGPGGTILVDGAKDRGVESLYRDLRRLTDCSPAFSKAHGKVFSARAGALPGDWAARETVLPEGFVTCPGVFSSDGVDPGSEALAAHFTGRPAGQMTGRAADLGAGWGYLSHRLLEAAPGIATLDLIEADHAALGAARRNVTDPRARFLWADATAPGAARYDLIISNPPFHGGNRAEPEIGRAFIRAAAAMLAPRGQFLMVANRHLPYEAALDGAFGEVTDLSAPPAFKIFRAARPRKAR